MSVDAAVQEIMEAQASAAEDDGPPPIIAKLDTAAKQDIMEAQASAAEDDGPPPIIAKLDTAAQLKADGNALFELKYLGEIKIEDACAKFEEAIALLCTLDQEKCPSANPEYQDLWRGACFDWCSAFCSHFVVQLA
jgi:hypothetical protein